MWHQIWSAWNRYQGKEKKNSFSCWEADESAPPNVPGITAGVTQMSWPHLLCCSLNTHLDVTNTAKSRIFRLHVLLTAPRRFPRSSGLRPQPTLGRLDTKVRLMCVQQPVQTLFLPDLKDGPHHTSWPWLGRNSRNWAGGFPVQQLKRDEVQFFAQTLHRREPKGED